LLRSQRVVLLNAIPAHPAPLISVVPDELEAGRTAANVLLTAGHRDGIYLIGVGLKGSHRPKPRSALAAVERLQGIEATLADVGVRPAGAVGCEDWQPEFGYDAVRKLVDGGADVKALICFNDRLAIGAYNALNDNGLEIPADVSIVSFDDDPIASWIRPKLTTIAIPHYELGRRSVAALLDTDRAEELERADAHGGVVRVTMPLRERASVQRAV
jgi:LacI family transcriptional regulator